MRRGTIQVICGEGNGKTAAAVGRAIVRSEHERNIIMIPFLKGNQPLRSAFLKRLEPEFRIFSFERKEERYESLMPGEQKEEAVNIQNSLNYARKVMCTGECDVLILDEVLGLLGHGILSCGELESLLREKNEDMDLILTGRVFPDELTDCVDEITRVENEK
ncbi:MAG: cob(I)yrinic acid a,c-diamide adenosyltransferase [Lachnospiraceae bacterium]|nr:cob(I)yrinic acid a,c-diamide adenosyltransferase [Lachnospiraceae bacterium]